MASHDANSSERSLIEAFRRSFGGAPHIFSAPGRVNLIGEHTDYNEGFVLPIAIDRRTYVAAAANDSRQVRVQSLDLNSEAVFALDQPTTSFTKKWLAYVAGVAFELERAGIELSGADLIISSQVPIGAGLSSSAALEVAVAAALSGICGRKLEATRLALIAQEAEHVYAGTRCGIMDQLTAAAAQRSQALLIDCRSLEVRHVKLNFPETNIVICNTNIKHDLAASAYNERRRECEQVVEILRRTLPNVRALRDVSSDELDKYIDDLPDVLYRRARHIVTENERTINAASALERNDIGEFGKLMWASHESLRQDYEVSCRELDLMVELAAGCHGVLGARMTGGGFGGCTINLVKRDGFESFREKITADYRTETGIDAEVYAVSSDDGVRKHN